jgi:hypothetical protein
MGDLVRLVDAPIEIAEEITESVIGDAEELTDLVGNTIEEVEKDGMRMNLTIVQDEGSNKRRLYWTSAGMVEWMEDGHLMLIIGFSVAFFLAALGFAIYPCTQLGHEYPRAVYTSNFLQQYHGTAVLPYRCVGNDPTGPCPPNYQSFRIVWIEFFFGWFMVIVLFAIMLIYGFLQRTSDSFTSGDEPGPVRRVIKWITKTYRHVILDDHLFVFSHVQMFLLAIIIHFFIIISVDISDINTIILLTFASGASAYGAWTLQWDNARWDKKTRLRTSHIKDIRMNGLVIEIGLWTLVFVIEVYLFSWFPEHARPGLLWGLLIVEWIMRWIQIIWRTVYYVHLDKFVRSFPYVREWNKDYIDRNIAFWKEMKYYGNSGRAYSPGFYDRNNFAWQLNPLRLELGMVIMNLIRYVVFLGMFYALVNKTDYTPNVPSNFFNFN